VEKIRIRDKHPGSTTLEFTTEKSEPEKNSSAVWPTVLRIQIFLGLPDPGPYEVRLQILLLSSKNIKKNLNSYSFVTSL
jgi:hypothetical protein